MKYIMLKSKVAGVEKLIPIIFPDFMVHADVDKAVKDLLLKIHQLESETFSAGDINIISCNCSGESSTLRVTSQDIDTDIIEMYDYLHGLIDTDDDISQDDSDEVEP